MTACGYCFIFVEYCSKKAMLYKIWRGERTAPVNAKIVQVNLVVLRDFGLFTLKYTGDSNRYGLAIA